MSKDLKFKWKYEPLEVLHDKITTLNVYHNKLFYSIIKILAFLYSEFFMCMTKTFKINIKDFDTIKTSKGDIFAIGSIIRLLSAIYWIKRFLFLQQIFLRHKLFNAPFKESLFAITFAEKVSLGLPGRKF